MDTISVVVAVLSLCIACIRLGYMLGRDSNKKRK
jgi:hypothetical protein